MKLDEIPATTKEFRENKKMKIKKKVNPDPGTTEQMDPMAMEQMMAMRGDPNLRPMGQKKVMRRADGGAVNKNEKYWVGEKGPEKYEPLRDNAPEMAHQMEQEWVTKTETIPKISVIRGMKKTRELPDERRKGGPVKKAKSYMVGEEGPEMFKPKQDGMIIPNDKLRPMGQKKAMRQEKGAKGARICKAG